MFGFWEMLVILAIILLIFGAKMIPKLTQAIKESIATFKDAATEETTEDNEKQEAK